MVWVTVGLLLLLLAAPCGAVDQIDPREVLSCKTLDGSSVDWFIVYKNPKQTENEISGLEYVFLDSTGTVSTQTTITDPDSALARTVRPLLKSPRNMPSTFGFLSYSDQPPGASANAKRFGHSKGVVMGDSASQTAVWITHSTPQFPFRRDQNSFWPQSGEAKGQSFMCVSLPFSELKILGEHLQNIHVYPYDYDLPLTFPREMVLASHWHWSSSQAGVLRSLHTRARTELKLMAKPTGSDAYSGDLWVKLANELHSDMWVQTWGCQPQRDESYCEPNQRQVFNIQHLASDTTSWSTNQDHSKWGVTIANGVTWTCFGDMNRSQSQYERWGGALCINNNLVNKRFKRFVQRNLPCGTSPDVCFEMDPEEDILPLRPVKRVTLDRGMG